MRTYSLMLGLVGVIGISNASCTLPSMTPMNAKVHHEIISKDGEKMILNDQIILDENFLYYQSSNDLYYRFEDGYFHEFDAELNHSNTYPGDMNHPLLLALMGGQKDNELDCQYTNGHYLIHTQVNDQSWDIDLSFEDGEPKQLIYSDEMDNKHILTFKHIQHEVIQTTQWTLPTNENTTFS